MNWERVVRIAKIEASLLKGFRNYMEKAGFLEVQVPHITKATGACENIATMFTLNYFGRKVYLTQTAQLQLEVLSQKLKRVFALIRSFRAEPEIDNRHLTEFSLFEFEHVGNLKELMKHIENALWCGVKKVVEERENELKSFNVKEDWLELFKPPYRKITYEEAIEQLNKEGFNLKFGDDLKSKHEKVIAEDGPVFVTHWPKSLKFFNIS